MVLTTLDALSSGFEGCEKKLEIDFCLTRDKQQQQAEQRDNATAATADNDSTEDQPVDLRSIPRATIDEILSLAKCTIISKQTNADFDAYVLSESSLFIYPAKVILKTCGTTLLLKTVSALLKACHAVGAEPDFLQFSRSNFLFPSAQHFPHRDFNEEVDYLNTELGVQGEAFILGSLNGARWHLYIWDFNRVDSSEYKQQTLEVIMFNLDAQVMRTFYNNTDEVTSKLPFRADLTVGQPCNNGDEATRVMGIDKFLPNSRVDSHLFTPCGYSCNGSSNVHGTGLKPQQSEALQPTASVNGQGNDGERLTKRQRTALTSSRFMGKQGKEQEAYFTIHITPEPECSFVSFETNAVLADYNDLVQSVVNTFKPGQFCVSLFVDGSADVSDSRAGLSWTFPEYVTRGTTHHTFQAGYNATCSQFEATQSKEKGSKEFGSHQPESEVLAVARYISPDHSNVDTAAGSKAALANATPAVASAAAAST